MPFYTGAFQPAGLGETGKAVAVADRRGISAAKNFRANGEMQFVDDSGAKESVVQLTSAFTQQTFDVPFLAQPLKATAEIEFSLAANLYIVCEPAHALKPAMAGRPGGQNDDR